MSVGAPSGPGSHASHGAAEASPPVGFDPSRDQFIDWIADELQRVGLMERAEAVRLGGACLEAAEADGQPFAHPDYAWTQGGAAEIATAYEIDHWEGAL